VRVVNPCSIPEQEGHPMSVSHDCIFRIFATTFGYYKFKTYWLQGRQDLTLTPSSLQLALLGLKWHVLVSNASVIAPYLKIHDS
jgi:hypothetical protein